MSQFQWQITSETVQESELGQFLIVLVLHTTPQRFQQPIPVWRRCALRFTLTAWSPVKTSLLHKYSGV